jgi:hypothetical protein
VPAVEQAADCQAPGVLSCGQVTDCRSRRKASPTGGSTTDDVVDARRTNDSTEDTSMTDTRTTATGNRTDGTAPRRTTPPQLSTETRPSARTSELIVLVVSSLAIIIAAYLDDAFNVEHGWTLVAILASAYLLSRGIAKAGSREPYRVERDS